MEAGRTCITYPYSCRQYNIEAAAAEKAMAEIQYRDVASSQPCSMTGAHSLINGCALHIMESKPSKMSQRQGGRERGSQREGSGEKQSHKWEKKK